jgi:hypothetical protein
VRFAEHEPQPRPGTVAAAPLETWFHLEHDLLRLRFDGKPEDAQEVWYWAKLSPHRDHRYRQEVSLHDLDRTADGPVRARLNVRAWSKPRNKHDASVPDHAIRFMLNGTQVGEHSWDGPDAHTFDLEIPAAAFAQDPNTIKVAVPRRTYGEDEQRLVDVVMLNWIEMRYPRAARIEGGQARFTVADGGEGRPIRLEAPAQQRLRVYSSTGSRIAAANGVLVFDAPAPDATYFASTDEHLMAVDNLVLDRPSALHTTGRQADYVMIAHRSLIEAVEPLAEFHRSRGLNVLVVDVQDVFDEFNHGIVHPRALRDFLAFAYHRWQPPRLQFTLLVGDASWDFKNPVAEDANYADWAYRPGERWQFIKNNSSPYDEGAERNDRNLVPTYNYPTYQGYAAADTWFACVDGDDLKPDIGIGRLPVVDPVDVTAIVDKTIAYASRPEVGPWRRTATFIANENSAFQRRSDAAAGQLASRGWRTVKIYPDPSAEINERHTRRILETFDAGAQVIHFVGHGGRYIWRTGPPDLKFNHDLFTLDHLEQLQPNQRLPVVLSLTCYSAPFDHPSADSLGEKLLRIDGRGAIAVVAASWRNSPTLRMAQALLGQLSVPGNPVGEAVRAAKHEMQNVTLIQMYNLLGDPAVPVAAPLHALELEAVRAGGELVVNGTGPEIGGDVLVEWIGADAAVVHSETVPANGSAFTATVDLDKLPDETEVAGVRAYQWNSTTGVDAVGWSSVGAGDAASTQKPTRSAALRDSEEMRP